MGSHGDVPAAAVAAADGGEEAGASIPETHNQKKDARRKNVAFNVDVDACDRQEKEDSNEEHVDERGEEEEDEEEEEEEEDNSENDDTEYQRMIRELGLMDSTLQIGDHRNQHHHHHHHHGIDSNSNSNDFVNIHHHHHHSSLPGNDADEDDLDDLDFILDEMDQRGSDDDDDDNDDDDDVDEKRRRGNRRRRNRGGINAGLGGDIGSPLFVVGANDMNNHNEDDDNADDDEDEEADDEEDDDDDDDQASFFVGDIEDELGDLLNEDLDAAIHSLTRDVGGFSKSAIDGIENGNWNGSNDEMMMMHGLPIMVNDDDNVALPLDPSAYHKIFNGTNENTNNFTTIGESEPQIVTAASLAAAAEAAEASHATISASSKGPDGSDASKTKPGTSGTDAETAKATAAVEASEAAKKTAAQEKQRRLKQQQAQTEAQAKVFQTLLKQHYQLLIQQAILSVRGSAIVRSKTSSSSSSKPLPPGLRKFTPGPVKPSSPFNVSSQQQQEQEAKIESGSNSNSNDRCKMELENTLIEDDQNFFGSSIIEEELALGLDSAVSMMQDLDQHRRDAIRTSTIYDIRRTTSSSSLIDEGDGKKEDETDVIDKNRAKGRRSLMSDLAAAQEQDRDQPSLMNHKEADRDHHKRDNRSDCQQTSWDDTNRRLTRAAFQRLQAQPPGVGMKRRTAFDVPGLWNVHKVFEILDEGRNFYENNDCCAPSAAEISSPEVKDANQMKVIVESNTPSSEMPSLLSEESSEENAAALETDVVSLKISGTPVSTSDAEVLSKSTPKEEMPSSCPEHGTWGIVEEMNHTTESTKTNTFAECINISAMLTASNSVTTPYTTTNDQICNTSLENHAVGLADSVSKIDSNPTAPPRPDAVLDYSSGVEVHQASLRESNIICRALTHNDACREVLKKTEVEFDEILLPGEFELTENFASPEEALSLKEDTLPENYTLTMDQKAFLRRNRNLFTASEDNLVMKGVNLYGEKQWQLVSDRYLPDRSQNVISQRYAKLCYMIYKAHGIAIDEKGNFAKPPKYVSVDEIDKSKLEAANLKKIPMPQVLNVHRWSLDEDLTILKSVPIMGNMWAELSARYLPHRDRGHLRKRYQVLERRVKATVSRIVKLEKEMEAKRAKREAAMQKKQSKSATKSNRSKAVNKGPKTPIVKTANLFHCQSTQHAKTGTLPSEKQRRSTGTLDQIQKKTNIGEREKEEVSGVVWTINRTGSNDYAAKTVILTTDTAKAGTSSPKDASKSTSKRTVNAKSKPSALPSKHAKSKSVVSVVRDKPLPDDEKTRLGSKSVSGRAKKLKSPQSIPTSSPTRSEKSGDKSPSISISPSDDLMSVEKAAASLAFMNKDRGVTNQEGPGHKSDDIHRAHSSPPTTTTGLEKPTKVGLESKTAKITNVPIHIKLAVPQSQIASIRPVDVNGSQATDKPKNSAATGVPSRSCRNPSPRKTMPNYEQLSSTHCTSNPASPAIHQDRCNTATNETFAATSSAVKRKLADQSFRQIEVKSFLSPSETRKVISSYSESAAGSHTLSGSSDWMHSRDELLGNGADASRLAVEKMIQEVGDEWSQLLSTRGPTGTDTGSSRVFPFSSRQHSPRRRSDRSGGLSRLAVDPYEMNNDISGLSVLKDVKKSFLRGKDDNNLDLTSIPSRKGTVGKSPRKKRRIGLFDRVVGGPSVQMPPSPPSITDMSVVENAVHMPVYDEEKKDGTPIQTSLHPTTAFESPLKNPGSFYSTTGTPSRLAPPMDAFRGSPGEFHTNSMLENNNSLFCDVQFDDGTNGTLGNDSLLFGGGNPLPLDEASRQEAQLQKTLRQADTGYAVRRAFAAGGHSSSPPDGKSMAGSAATADDLDAISALEALSNSPFKRIGGGTTSAGIIAEHREQSSSSSLGQEAEIGKDSSTSNGEKRGAGKSLFAKVIGKINSKKDGTASSLSSSSKTAYSRKGRKKGSSADESPKKRLKF